MSANNILPEIEFYVNSSGVTIFCTQLITPRFVPFDQKGRCPTCKSDNVELEYIIQTEGITLVCPRFKKDKFVQFDPIGSEKNSRGEGSNLSPLREISNCRIKSRNKSYNFPIFEREGNGRKRKMNELSEKNEVIDIMNIPLPPNPQPTPTDVTVVDHSNPLVTQPSLETGSKDLISEESNFNLNNLF